MGARTLYDKLWDSHVVRENDDGTSLLYIDRQLIHEVTSPQAFEGLRIANRTPWNLSANLATPDHNVPTNNREQG
ncbi:MAG: 3-isopropylmalate dehydratase large subunit, partial [Thiotrichaceae bacterium]|nr:3-isopropylmalate dehydratase large subunit [Thiotrichaceae bacterium]